MFPRQQIKLRDLLLSKNVNITLNSLTQSMITKTCWLSSILIRSSNRAPPPLTPCSVDKRNKERPSLIDRNILFFLVNLCALLLQLSNPLHSSSHNINNKYSSLSKY